MKRALLCALLSLTSAPTDAEVVVIVHPSNNARLNQEQIQQLFLGKTKSFPGDTQAIPYDQNGESPARDTFYDKIVHKKGNQLRAYWSRLVFTGKGRPPKEIGDDIAVRKLIASNPNAVGYIDRQYLDASVRVAFQTP